MYTIAMTLTLTLIRVVIQCRNNIKIIILYILTILIN